MLDNLREIVVRGILVSVAFTPRQVTNALLSALDLPHLATFVVGWYD